MTYGVEFDDYYDPENEEHEKRKNQMYRGSSGHDFIPGRFGVILPKVFFAFSGSGFTLY
jgi:hypothetical protein